MKQKYTFFDGGTIEFDDTKSIKELISYAFAKFGYYEPMGMEVVTIFQAHHPDTNTGWFTTNISLTCAEEIKKPNELCFAYYLPKVFYFAEGGWGHHMSSLGNHPKIPKAVSLHIRFDDFKNTVVINGRYSFNDIISTLKRTGYIDNSCNSIEVIPVGCESMSYSISFSDSIMSKPLTKFERILEQYNSEKINLAPGEYIYHTILRIY